MPLLGIVFREPVSSPKQQVHHRKSPAIAAGLTLCSALLFGACFFDEVINEEPIPGIVALDESNLHYIGDVLRFNATKTIDDDDELLAEWTAFACESVGNCRKLDELSFKSVAAIFEVPVLSHENIEVQLRIVDRYGAVRLQPDLFSSVISNREPEIDVQIQGTQESEGSYVLGLPIHFVGLVRSKNSSGVNEFLPELLDLDGDSTELIYKLLPPTGSVFENREFSPEGETGYRLVADIPGEWGVVLSATDGFGGSAEIRSTFLVAQDLPPCLEVLSPRAIDDAYYPLDSLEEARRFSVLSVDDTLDPFPLPGGADPILAEASFRWFLRAPGASEFVAIAGLNASSYVVDPALYQPGDSVALRVEVQDRVSGPERVLPCAEDVWSCALNTASSCFQRKTWGVVIR